MGTAFLEESVTNSRMQNMLEMHATDIGKILCGLVEKGMLISDSRGRWTTYRINTDYQKKPDQLHLADIVQPEIKMNDTDKEIYAYMSVNKTITAAQVISITRITTQQGASAALNRLIKQGLIEKKHIGRQVYYQIK